ncbi:hypothetical protein AHMF7605_02730 [Adhaeribacter arboris]|uniref:Insulinase family protein n=1 Tax=Adhaeribacter arboris TaxID=2072846 RepID=A0A2T2YAI4_9BACT|nr:pitrilysin family protein [Adhaeribacter arboris]PSR52514.1 hypothetical protein AHMF7605_02730 [Adhaeribacter arboris]
MKNICLILFISLLSFTAGAQSATTTFTVNGLKVIFKPTQKETISVRMFYRGGVTNFSLAQAGLENLTLAAATTGGTQKYKEETFRDMADEYGIDISGYSEYDYGTINLDCVADYFNEGWNLWSQAILKPTFDSKCFAMQRDKIMAAIRERSADPEDRLEELAIGLSFAGTPYAKSPLGEEETLSKFTADSVKNYYYHHLLNKNRMFLVVAGKISREDLERKIKESFSGLPDKPYTPFVYTNALFQEQRLVWEQRELATNYMCGLINAPAMNSPDFPAYLLTIKALSGRIFQEVRMKQNLSYDPGATLTMRQLPYATLYASSTNPKATLLTIATEYVRMRQNQVSAELLTLLKKSVKQGYYHTLESSQSLVESLGEAEIFGDWKLSEDMINKINNVTTQEMNAAFQKYTKGIRWAYLGDKQLAQEAFNQK